MIKNFSKLSYQDRLTSLVTSQVIDEDDRQALEHSIPPAERPLLEGLIENVIGAFHHPLGLLPDLIMDGKTYNVPMVIEESSVIAAASFAAKWMALKGTLTTKRLSRNIIGQIHFQDVKNLPALQHLLITQKESLMTLLNTQVVAGLYKRGGGIKDIQLRLIPLKNTQDKVVIHISMDPCDAMGANSLNQACEYLSTHLKTLLPKETPLMSILSNLSDQALVRATLTLNNISAPMAEKIEAASVCAQIDPYRAATHNKGILNGIDAVLIATGNDWRAVEAGAHAFAARSGHYTSLSSWSREGSSLVGELEMPLNLGIVGGVTKTHPMARLCLKLLGVQSADELARVVASVGLLQNLAALRALTSHGITKGHMKLHLKNWLMSSAKTAQEYQSAEPILQKRLQDNKTITHSEVNRVLEGLRNNK